MNQREQNLATLKDYCARMIKGDFSALDEIMSPDWLTHASPRVIHEAFLGVTKAYEGELAFFQQVTGAFKAPELLLNKMMAIDDEHVVLNYTITGIHSEGKFFECGRPGAGKSGSGLTVRPEPNLETGLVPLGLSRGQAYTGSVTTAQPLTTTAVVAARHGGPEVLKLQQWEVAPPGPDEVRLAVEAAGISFADLLICQGLHPERRRAPFVPGWDVVGVVESVGLNIHDVEPGDRVAALSVVGGWARHVVTSGSLVVPIPRELEAMAAVCLVMDYIVAYQMMTRTVSVRRGDTVLFQGVGGGVGTALMQLGRQIGVRVLGTDRETKRAHVEVEGGVLIDFEREDVVERCKELTGGTGVDAAFDGIGATARASLRAVRPKGQMVWFGMVTMLSGGARNLQSTARTVGNVAAVFGQSLRPGGKRTSLYSIQKLARSHPDWYRADLTTLFAMLADRAIHPRIAAVWKLSDVPQAVSTFAKGSMPGKQVVAIASS